ENEAEDKHAGDKSAVSETIGQERKYQLEAPLAGDMIPLEDVDDPVFSSRAMGKGVAIEPTDNAVVAPFTGKVSTVFPTKHAIGVISEEGVELLIHIGLDTVQLDSQFYDIHVEQDATIKEGDKLITFDKQKIKDAGYKITTPVIVTNTNDYLDILPTD